MFVGIRFSSCTRGRGTTVPLIRNYKIVNKVLVVYGNSSIRAQSRALYGYPNSYKSRVQPQNLAPGQLASLEENKGNELNGQHKNN